MKKTFQKKLPLKLSFPLFLFIFFLFFAKNLSAQNITNPLLPSNLQNLSGTAFLGKFINLAINLCLVGGGIIFFFMLVSGGIRWISSGGDKTKIEASQKQVTHAFIGLLILLSTFAIIKLIESVFNINILKINIPTL